MSLIVPRVEDLDPVLINHYNTFVVIDVLRFSTTVCSLLANKADRITVFESHEEARQYKNKNPDVLLVGDKNGSTPDGFDLNNSPRMVEKTSIDGATIGIATTNGTRAINTIPDDKEIVIGSTVNAEAVAQQLHGKENICLLAAGTEGAVTPEDLVGAELINSHLSSRNLTADDFDGYRERVRKSEWADNVRDLGFGDDIEKALAFDSTDIVPVLEDGRITAMSL
jgi:2-phosphosulfolactate phosphatase